MTSHPIDHLVFPTRDLETARARLGALGFTVAPKGTHPFGTVNCCVYLRDNTFLEPLAIGDAAATAKAAETGNMFVSRDRAFRERNGDEGFSAVVLGTDDADADHARYLAAGVSAGQRLDFSRPFVDAAGRQDIASFRLAFAATPDMADAFLFSCERVNASKVDRTALEAHANGVKGIREVIGVSDEAQDKLRLLAAIADTPPAEAGGHRLVLPNTNISLTDPAGFEGRFGLGVEPSRLRFAAVVFTASDLGALAGRLASAEVEHHFQARSLVVPPAPGQGAAFIFEEDR
ncbi:VOC family protein [Mesorhizobium sp. SP-1A]|uniref:VOC family protein n=1 Tax=Mesorhizobium sp. SP-1A TaxID=3077840 RepID=UPI0028F71F86|nr:VOC family protein [Mesorhizobium sp. SP-1A]